ncbi:MAG: pectin acetylesterase-family hydrolase [Clostridiales bacterium]|nr:pectin acetylesterase-family hydrolase [Clostridiales bacterium]
MKMNLRLSMRELSARPEPLVWYRYKMPGLMNAGGSENWLYLKKGISNDLIIFLIGGGFSYNGEMARCPGNVENFFEPQKTFYTDECHPNNEYYFFHVLGNHGLFSDEAENCFVGWSVAMINYGTADIHIGDGEFYYTDNAGQQKTLHHHGYRNFHAALQKIKEIFPNPEKLIIAGESAGGFGVSALADEIIDSYIDCNNITMCIDSAALCFPNASQIVSDVWKAPLHIASRVTTDNIVLDFIRTRRHSVKSLFVCGYPDAELASFQNYIDYGELIFTESARDRISKVIKEQTEKLKENGFGIYLHDFRKDGMVQHCTLDALSFRDGMPSPMEWLWRAVNDDITDVGMELLEGIL